MASLFSTDRPRLSEGHHARPASGQRGRLRLRARRSAFTLIELIAVVTIIGLIVTLALPNLWESIERARVAHAIGDLKALVTEVESAHTLPANLAAIGRGGMLDPWGRPYVYAPFPPPKGGGNGKKSPPPQGARKDRFLVPINSRYDLYSVGKDGGSVAPLTAKASRDDIVVANDGGFIGLAKNY